MNIYFISDLHLNEQQPEITQKFFLFLEKYASEAKAIYILGDFFDTWIGDDDTSFFTESIIEALNKANQKTPVFLMRGNRDFLLGKKFADLTGCQLLGDEEVINIATVPHLLMHGDSLCLADTAYQRFRFYTHIALVQKIFLALPLAMRRKFAMRARLKSQDYTNQAKAEILDVTDAAVIKVMQKCKVQHLIHGHTHRPAMHNFILAEQPATRTVLGAWHAGAHVLCCDEKNNKSFITY